MNVHDKAGALEHQRLLEKAVAALIRKGYTDVCAAVSGCDPVEPVGPDRAHCPDATCIMTGEKQVWLALEVETCDTLLHASTVALWITSLRAAEELSGRLHIVVPSFCGGRSGRGLAEHLLGESGVSSARVTIWSEEDLER